MPNEITLKSDHSMRKSRYLLKPGEDTVLPNLIPIVNQKDPEFPMPHLYSGNLHAHEDGEEFIMEDQNEDANYEYNFENEAAKTDKFIPYTYIIEMSETYEDDRQPVDSETSQTTHPGTLQSLGSAYQHRPRLKSEDTIKKVEIFIEKGYDRGAYDHKGYQDHNSKWDKYKESEEGRYGGSSSSKTRENEKYHLAAHPNEEKDHYNALERSGSSPSSNKLVSSRGKHLSSFSDKHRHGTKGRDSRTGNKVISIPSSKWRDRTKNNSYSRKQSKQPVSLNDDHPQNARVNSPSNNKRRTLKHSNTNSNNKDFSFFQPGGGLSSLYNSPFNSPPFSSASKLSTSSSSSPSFENSINQLFAFPRSSSMYDNLQSRHTIPAFGSADQKLSASEFNTESTGRQPKLKDAFPIPCSRITNSRVLTDNSISLFRSIFPSSSPLQQSSKHAAASRSSQDVSLSKHIGQPVSLLEKQPCLATQALTANFEFGKFKPQLGSPTWMEKDTHVLEPLKGQVDILREQVYAPALREALCL